MSGRRDAVRTLVVPVIAALACASAFHLGKMEGRAGVKPVALQGVASARGAPPSAESVREPAPQALPPTGPDPLVRYWKTATHVLAVELAKCERQTTAEPETHLPREPRARTPDSEDEP